MTIEEPAGFAAFRRLLQDDPGLVADLRPIMDRDAFVAAAVACGAARGFSFAAADVEAALHANRHGWMSHWLPVL